MASLSNFLRALIAALTVPPPAPCCASEIRWASFH